MWVCVERERDGREREREYYCVNLCTHVGGGVCVLWNSHYVKGPLNCILFTPPATQVPGKGDDPSSGMTWAQRKLHALRAYHEWMPTRFTDVETLGAGHLAENNRTFQFGDLAQLSMLETRVQFRTDTRVETWGGIVRNVSSTLSEAATAAKGERGLPAYASYLEDERRRVSKTIVGRSQMDWLGETLDASTKRGVRWQVVGQQQVGRHEERREAKIGEGKGRETKREEKRSDEKR